MLGKYIKHVYIYILSFITYGRDTCNAIKRKKIIIVGYHAPYSEEKKTIKNLVMYMYTLPKKVTQHDFDRLYFFYPGFLFIKLDISRKPVYLHFD